MSETVLRLADDQVGQVAQQQLAVQFLTVFQRLVDTSLPILASVAADARRIADGIERLAETHAPTPSEKVDSPYVADRLASTTTWVAALARDGGIPSCCIVPGTGNGKRWKFYRERIDRWIESR